MKKWVFDWYCAFIAQVVVMFIPLTYYSAQFADFVAHQDQYLVNAYEIRCTNNNNGEERRVHVVAPDEGDAVIAFREEYSIEDWTVVCMHKVIETAVIERL